MMRIATALGLSILIGMAGAAPASAAPAKAAHKKPPPKPAAAEGPSLAVTLAYIRDKVAQQGSVAYAGASHDSADTPTWAIRSPAKPANLRSAAGRPAGPSAAAPPPAARRA